ncbi:MAG: response regulator [Dehalococcoidia bacterium]
MSGKGFILVVDDEESVRELVSEALEEAGYFVDVASSGWEALEILTGASFDLVFLDIMMPGMSGQQVMDRIKIERPELPVVMLTAVVDRGAEAEFRQRGAVDYLKKPCRMETVVATADRILQKKG